MQDLNDKITGNSLTASEWNQQPSEVQNVIEGLGITLSGADLNQLGKAIAGYAANGDYYTDSGVADVYVLTKIGSKQSPPAYTDGFSVFYKAGNANTGASTVNVAGLGVKSIRTLAGAALSSGNIKANTLVELRYDNANGWFEILSIVQGLMVQFVQITENTGSSGTTAIPEDNTIPQNTEGDEVKTLAITPTNASNNLIIDVYIGMMDSIVSSNPAIALFQDSIVDALAVSKVITSVAGPSQGGTLKYIMPAGTTSEIIFKVRIGLTSGTLYFNRNSVGELYGIASRSYITITEVKA